MDSVAMIGCVLENAGFRVVIIVMPDYKNPNSMTALGKSRLFFGVTSGNVDSLVANCTELDGYYELPFVR